MWFLCLIAFLLTRSTSHVGARAPTQYVITLGIFSGRENPTWTLDTTNPFSFQSIQFGLAPHKQGSESLTSRVGYQGFVVEGNVGEKWTISKDSDKSLETMLLESGSGNIPEDVFITVMNEINHGQTPKAQPPARTSGTNSSTGECYCGNPGVCTEYQPGNWNDADQIRFSNNCYNYATNTRTNTFAQPGRASGHMYRSLTPDEVKAAAISDGLCDLGTPQDIPDPEGRLVALVVWEGVDFHWFRRDCDQKWSHKPGRTPATYQDNDQQIIMDPRTANTGGYEFVCFMSVCTDDVDISK